MPGHVVADESDRGDVLQTEEILGEVATYAVVIGAARGPVGVEVVYDLNPAAIGTVENVFCLGLDPFQREGIKGTVNGDENAVHCGFFDAFIGGGRLSPH
jgi:hypothetical protein